MNDFQRMPCPLVRDYLSGTVDFAQLGHYFAGKQATRSEVDLYRHLAHLAHEISLQLPPESARGFQHGISPLLTAMGARAETLMCVADDARYINEQAESFARNFYQPSAHVVSSGPCDPSTWTEFARLAVDMDMKVSSPTNISAVLQRLAHVRLRAGDLGLASHLTIASLRNPRASAQMQMQGINLLATLFQKNAVATKARFLVQAVGCLDHVSFAQDNKGALATPGLHRALQGFICDAWPIVETSTDPELAVVRGKLRCLGGDAYSRPAAVRPMPPQGTSKNGLAPRPE